MLREKSFPIKEGRFTGIDRQTYEEMKQAAKNMEFEHRRRTA